MSTKQRSRELYPHPFSKAYWRDAASELKDTKILVVAALMIALRVAMKGIYIPLGPALRINTAFIANALGAMIFGPVVATLGAIISDTLGCMIFPQGPYFLPFVLTEIAGSLIFALLLYRAKLSPTRVILSRFLICLLVNILLNAPIMMLYYKMVLGKTYLLFQLPHMIKELAMFPIESWVLAFILSVLAPITYRMGLTFDPGPGEGALKFTAKQLSTLALLLAIGISCTVGYLFYYYDTTSLSASYEGTERYDYNQQMNGIVLDLSETDAQMTGDNTVTVIESAYKKFGKGYTIYNVAVYTVDTDALAESGNTMDTLRAYSKSKAAKDETMTRVASAVLEVNKDGTLRTYSYTPEK